MGAQELPGIRVLPLLQEKRTKKTVHTARADARAKVFAHRAGAKRSVRKARKQPLSPLRLVAVMGEQNSFDKSILVFYTKIPASMPTAWREYKKDRKYIVMLTLDKIYHAAFVLKDVARRTDLIEAPPPAL